MFDVICLGNSCEDIFLESSQFSKGAVLETKELESFKIGSKIEVENLKILPGGGGSNTSVGLAKQDLSVSLISRTGQDVSGQQILKNLYNHGVDSSMMQIDKKTSSAVSIVLISKSGERTILIYRGAASNISSKLFDLNQIQTQWFYITSLGGNFDLIGEVFNIAKTKNIKIAYNPGNQELEQNQKIIRLLGGVDILFLNVKESAKLLETDKNQINVILNKLQQITKTSVITNNENGAYYIDKKRILKVNSIKTDVKDATGAGDAFGCGFLGSYIKGENPETCLKSGIVNAVSVIKKTGAQTGLQSSFLDDSNIKIESFNN